MASSSATHGNPKGLKNGSRRGSTLHFFPWSHCCEDILAFWQIFKLKFEPCIANRQDTRCAKHDNFPRAFGFGFSLHSADTSPSEVTAQDKLCHSSSTLGAATLGSACPPWSSCPDEWAARRSSFKTPGPPSSARGTRSSASRRGMRSRRSSEMRTFTCVQRSPHCSAALLNHIVGHVTDSQGCSPSHGLGDPTRDWSR